MGVYRTSLRTHTDTPTLPAHFGLPPSNRELRVRRVSANRKAAIEGKKESRISSKGWTVLQRFRERRNRYARAHNTPTQQLNNAATLSFPSPSVTSVSFTRCVCRVLNTCLCFFSPCKVVYKSPPALSQY